MNKSIFIGRMATDPKVMSSAGKKTVAYFRIAVERNFKQEGAPNADYFSCVTFGESWKRKRRSKRNLIFCFGKIRGQISFSNRSMTFITMEDMRKIPYVPGSFFPICGIIWKEEEKL